MSTIEKFAEVVAYMEQMLPALKAIGFGGATDVEFEGEVKPSLEKRFAELKEAAHIDLNSAAQLLDEMLEVKQQVQVAAGGAFVFPDIAAGLAETDVGQQFQVVTAAGDALVRYQHDAGAVARAVAAYPTTKIIGATHRTTQRAAGLTDLLRQPNHFVDDSFERMAAANGADVLDETGRYSKSGGHVQAVQLSDGRAGMRFTSTSAGGAILWMQSVSALGLAAGQAITISVRFDALSAGSSAELGVVQSTSAGLSTEISGTRAVRHLLAEDVPSTASATVSIHPAATYIGFYCRPAQVGAALDCTDILVAAGGVRDFRPHVARHMGKMMEAEIGPGLVAQARDSADMIAAGLVDSREPNLVSRTTADFSALLPLQGGSATHALVDGVSVWRITCVSEAVESYVAMGRWPRSAVGNYASAGVRIESVEPAEVPGAAYVARALLRQFDASGLEILSARRSVSIATQSGVSAPRTVRIESVPVHINCVQLDFYLSLRGPVGRTMSFRDLLFCSGRSASWRPPLQPSVLPRSVFVGPAGSDAGVGTAASPLGTLDRAIDMVGGSGIVYVLPGSYGPAMRITPGKITGHIKIIGVRQSMGIGNYEWPVIRMSSPVTGISKTPGYTKIYQASIVGLPPLASFQWAYQDAVADPRTLIGAADRSPQHRGRSHRLQHCARLIKASPGSLSAALAEMDATAEPMSYIDGGTLYFTIVGGGDGAAANIYIDAATGFISSAVRGSCGALDIQGLRVMYGGINLSPFAGSRLDEVTAVGSRGNCIDYNVLSFGTIETACGGSQQQYTGDGLNGHNGAVLTEGNDLYSHDNWDDGFSDHEGCTTRMIGGGLVEYNGGTGLAPAYGADTVAAHFVSRRNQRRGTYKPGAFAVVGRAEDGGPADYGDTLARFIDCEDIESLTSFSDAFISQGFDSKAVCVSCRSIRPATRGFNVYKVVNCGYVGSATSTATAPETIVEVVPVIGA